MMLRLAREKSKGTWVELPLCELELRFTSAEDKEWLKTHVVESLKLSCFAILEYVVSNISLI